MKRVLYHLATEPVAGRPGRLRPSITRFKVSCVADYTTGPIMAPREGIEPSRFGVEIRCHIQFDYQGNWCPREDYAVHPCTARWRAIAEAMLRIAPGNAERTDMQHVNSVSTYRWCTFQLVWVSGFEPLTSRVQGAHSGQAELHPVN